MSKNLASRVFDGLNIHLTTTERGLLAYLLGWFLDEDRGFCDLSQTRIAQALIRRRKLATTSEAYRRTVNVYLGRLERAGLVVKSDASPGRVARLSPGSILQAAIDSARENPNKKSPIDPASPCPCCGQVMGGLSAGHGQVSMKGTMTQPKTEPLLTTDSPHEAENLGEKEVLIKEILSLRLTLASRGLAGPIRSTVAYRRALQTNSLDALRKALTELQSAINVQKQEKVFATPEVEAFQLEAELVEDSEMIGQQQLDALPTETVEKMIDQEVEFHLQGEHRQTWNRWDHNLRREQARYHLAIRIGHAILNGDNIGWATQLTVESVGLSPQTIDHVGIAFLGESPHVAI